jgi:hypothetical protein
MFYSQLIRASPATLNFQSTLFSDSKKKGSTIIIGFPFSIVVRKTIIIGIPFPYCGQKKCAIDAG